MNADLDLIIGKIKKCLALSQSDNPNEAAAALRQAQSLMRKYELDEVALTAADITAEQAGITSTNGCRPPGWEAVLVTLVGQTFGCRALVVKGARQADGRRGKAAYRYVGVSASAVTAAYTLTVLLRQLRKCRSEHLRVFRAEARAEGWQLTAAEERSAGDAFCLGWLNTVRRLVTDFANPEPVEAAIKRRFQEISQGRVTSGTKCRIGAYDQGSINAGAEAAKNVSLHRPVHDMPTAPALGYW